MAVQIPSGSGSCHKSLVLTLTMKRVNFGCKIVGLYRKLYNFINVVEQSVERCVWPSARDARKAPASALIKGRMESSLQTGRHYSWTQTDSRWLYRRLNWRRRWVRPFVCINFGGPTRPAWSKLRRITAPNLLPALTHSRCVVRATCHKVDGMRRAVWCWNGFVTDS